VLERRQATPDRGVLVPLGWLLQVLSPSVVRRIVPLLVLPLPRTPPTAKQVLGRGQATPSKVLGVPLGGRFGTLACHKIQEMPLLKIVIIGSTIDNYEAEVTNSTTCSSVYPKMNRINR
jgi:hypothetical protein